MADSHGIMTLRYASLAWSLALLVALAPCPTAADSQPGAQVFLGATLDLATEIGKDDGPDINVQIRGESPFDNLRLRLFGDAVLNRRFTVFNQILIDPSTQRLGLESFLRSYLRYKVFGTPKADLFLEGGKIPTPFGSFSPRAYSDRSPLVSYPLIHHYFSSLRSNQLPADNADLLSHRGQGAQGFSGFAGGGSTQLQSGLPMIYDPCWDVGVAALGSLGPAEYRVAVTQGTLSSPRFKGGDNNGGKQLAGRVAFVPATGILLGVSYARGPYLDSAVANALPVGARVEDYDQEIYGLDLEFGIRHLDLIAEFAANRWQSPNITDAGGSRADLTQSGGYVEAKYTVRPGLYAAARFDWLDFGAIEDGTGTRTRLSWDYAIHLWELGIGYYFTDRVIGKLVRQDQRSERPGSESSSFWAVQLSASF